MFLCMYILSFRTYKFSDINAECEQNSEGEVPCASDTCKCFLTYLVIRA